MRACVAPYAFRGVSGESQRTLRVLTDAHARSRALTVDAPRESRVTATRRTVDTSFVMFPSVMSNSVREDARLGDGTPVKSSPSGSGESSVSELQSVGAPEESPEPEATRRPASGPCGCARRSCWHRNQCRSSGVVRILRAPQPKKEFRSSVVLCRECAAPTQRNRVA